MKNKAICSQIIDVLYINLLLQCGSDSSRRQDVIALKFSPMLKQFTFRERHRARELPRDYVGPGVSKQWTTEL